MLTIFSTPKPFKGQIATIQRNAIRSWTLLHPDCEVILFGNEEGTAEVARELGIRHESEVRRNELGTPFLNYIFDRAQEIARHPLVCYVNCDILLMSDFRDALRHVSHWQDNFLMIGQRWDIDINEVWMFEDPHWEQRLRALALQESKQRQPNWIDYFLFPRGMYHQKIPPLLIGRASWDNWLVWKARSLGRPIVDASSAIMAIHQNHGYAHLPEGEETVWRGEEFRRNLRLAGGLWHLYSIEDATHKLSGNGLQYNWRHWLVLAKRNILITWGLMRAAPRTLRRISVLLRGQQGV